MLALPDRKKRIETQYVEEARRASPIFPVGRLVPHEKPDFLLVADRGKIGLEVTELCREEPRAEAGRLAKVPDKAKALYDWFPGADPVDVSIAFRRAETVSVNALTKSLADFVYANRANKGAGFRRNLPKGYCHIGIHKPSVSGGRWRRRAFDTVVAPKELVESRIAEKNSRVADYKLSAPEVSGFSSSMISY